MPLIVVVMATFLLGAVEAWASDESAVRGTVQQVFQQLRAGDYGSVYDSLPSSTRKRMSRERFVAALKQAQDRYVLDRMSVGSVRVAGNVAVADTELYGRVTNPLNTEGKIVVQQYLIREDGKWRVATGDRSTIQQFLKTNPNFARRFPIRQPKIFVKRDGSWIEFRIPRW